MQKYTDYRPNVAAIVLSSQYPQKCEFILFRRKDMKKGWQFPQGGIDEDEEKVVALLRELDEEIGTNDVEILGEYPHWIKYDFPKKSTSKQYPFRGQSQKYFLVKLKGDDAIDLNTHKTPEFDQYISVSKDELLKKSAFLKRRTYKRVIEYFTKEGLL